MNSMLFHIELILGCFFYRSDLLEKYGRPVPKTWDDLIQTSKIIMNGETNMYGLAGSWYEYEGLTCNYLEYLWSNNGAVFKNGQDLALNTSEAKEALNMMVDMIYAHASCPPDVTTYTSGDVRKQFLDENLIFMRDWPAGWRKLNEDSSSVKGKVQVAPLPSFTANGSSHGTFGGGCL